MREIYLERSSATRRLATFAAGRAEACGNLPGRGVEGIAWKITAVETIQVAEYSNLVWVELHTDEGLIGLGDTFRSPAATAA